MRFLIRKAVRAILLPVVVSGALAACADAEHADDTASDPSETSEALSTRTIPSELTPPRGSHLAFWVKARGAQVYACKQTADAYAWTFVEPDADLFLPYADVLVGHHYAGPTWEMNDGSSVVATKVAGATVDATAVAWLLLKVVSHGGHGLLSTVTYVQRLYTAGGIAPTEGCDAEHVGDSTDVPYTATYAFYR